MNIYVPSAVWLLPKSQETKNICIFVVIIFKFSYISKITVQYVSGFKNKTVFLSIKIRLCSKPQMYFFLGIFLVALLLYVSLWYKNSSFYVYLISEVRTKVGFHNQADLVLRRNVSKAKVYQFVLIWDQIISNHIMITCTKIKSN